ncbi:hypothetical protein BASA81_018252 [Batrachochytrium salamandrivorans]|nr:hypothetical protein BASA81_018252 [Batrachochytrium salamandrivorans]
MLFNSLSLNEHVSKSRVKNLLTASTDLVPLDEKKKINLYTKCLRNDGTYKIGYERPELKAFGRVTPKPHTGLGVFCRTVRGYLANEVYIDVDMVNCHPVLLHTTFKEHGLDDSIIGDYVADREAFLAREGIEKTDFLAMLNKEDFKGTGVMKALHDQIYKVLVPALQQKFKGIKIKKGDGYNLKGKFIANYLQDMELKVLSRLYQFGQENGF